MALEIKENRGIFEISGNLSSPNLGALKIYFESVLETSDSIVINLENVKNMDSSSALFFEKIYNYGAERNKIVSIVGRQNHNIIDIMNQTNTDYILSSDRV